MASVMLPLFPAGRGSNFEKADAGVESVSNSFGRSAYMQRLVRVACSNPRKGPSMEGRQRSGAGLLAQQNRLVVLTAGN